MTDHLAPTEVVRFSEALARVIASMGTPPVSGVIVRDLFGRLRFGLDVDDTAISEQTKKAIDKYIKKKARVLQQAGGAFASADHKYLFFYRNALVSPEDVFESPDLSPVEGIDGWTFLDRFMTGRDWTRGTLTHRARRAALFGIKGGVGRSTALAVWARYLAKHEDKSILVVDLDLESPGIGSILLPDNRLPERGVVDWFVEQAIGQDDDALIEAMVANSPLEDGTGGRIRVVPAAGLNEKEYMAKLARVYLPVPRSSHQGVEEFAERLNSLLCRLEEKYQPDAVLLDSRAGLHDISAVLITRATDLAFLFAVGTPQTWSAYRHLFSHWKNNPKRLRAFRDNLRVVGSMVPETGAEEYRERLLEDSWGLFQEIYEAIDPTVGNPSYTEEPFNFDLNDIGAPHYPVFINWSRAYMEFNPLGRPNPYDDAAIEASFGVFLTKATELLLGGA